MHTEALKATIEHQSKGFPTNPILWVRGNFDELLARDSIEIAMREARADILMKFQAGNKLNQDQVDDIMTQYLERFNVDYTGWGYERADGSIVTVYHLGTTEQKGMVPFFLTQVPRGLIAGEYLKESAIDTMLRRRHGR